MFLGNGSMSKMCQVKEEEKEQHLHLRTGFYCVSHKSDIFIFEPYCLCVMHVIYTMYVCMCVLLKF